MLTKKCTGCGRELPADVYHFDRQKLGKYGFRSTCKECRGRSFGVQQKNLVFKAREGYKICTSCDKELPANIYYFHRDRKTSNGFQPKCKVCSGGKYGIHQPNKSIKTKPGFKVCVVCETEKLYEEFSKLRESSDGYMSRCKDCDKKIREEYRSKPEIKVKRAEYRKKYSKLYYATEKGHTVNKVNCQKRRARKQNLKNIYDTDKWQQALNYFGNSCAYCGKSGKRLTHEHFIPISKGGEYTADNIIPACSYCNGSKKNKDFHEWYPEQSFYSKLRERKILKYLGYKSPSMQQVSIDSFV